MFSFKRSLLGLVGLFVIVGLLATLVPLVSRGQGNSGNAPNPLNVNVVNTPTVRDADNPARQPFHADLPFEVPTGKRLVIEYFSAQVTTAPDCHLLSLNLSTSLEGHGTVNHSFAPTFVAVGGGVEILNRITVSQPTRLYADPGVTVAVGHTSAGFNCNVQINTSAVSGYLVDVR